MRIPMCILTALALAVGTSSLAGAQSAPTPPCGLLGNDAKGDAEPANLDLTGLWFETTGGKVIANIRIANLDTTVPADATGILWYALWTLDDGIQYFVNAQVEFPASEPTFNYGFVDTSSGATSVRTSQGEAVGQFFPGADGVVRIEIPPDIGGAPGRTLKAATADTQSTLSVLGTGLLATHDEMGAKSYTAAPCAGDAPPAPTGPTPAPTPGPGPSNPEGAPSGLAVKASTKMPRAKRVKRSLSVRLTSSEKVTAIEAALLRGSARSKNTVAKGKLASVDGRATLKLRVSKRIKKGSYTLYLKGKNANGALAERTFRLRFK